MEKSAATPTPVSAGEDRPPSRKRLVLARSLGLLGILLLLISVLANFVDREALDESRFRETSEQLIADPAIRDQLAATLVDSLYANVDVSAVLADRLPSNLEGLAGPLAGIAREATDRAARRMLERPRVQETFVTLASFSQRQLVAVLDGDLRLLETTGGRVVLDVRPLVLQLGDRLRLVTDLEDRIPEGAAQITILESQELKTAQDLTKALRFVADWTWIPVLLLWAAALWLARRRRRMELRAIAIGLIVAGALLLIVRSLAGRYLVDSLVASDSVRPAVENAYAIITDLLAGAGWTLVIVGAIALVGVWLGGGGRRATAARGALAGYLSRPELAYGALVLAYLGLLWWRPTPQFGFWLNVAILFGLAVLGLEVLRRLSAQEFPDAEPRNPFADRSFGGFALSRRRAPERATPAELERLAALHASGALDDAEFAAAKSALLGAAGQP